jgi:alpha-L-rhamnosidase
MADAQLSSGLVPDLVPENIVFSGGFRDDVNWGSAIIQTPWQIYQNYGDTAVLSTYYPNMVEYMNYLQTRVTGNLVSYGSSGLGDWGETSVTSITTPIDLVENWGYYRDEVAMANIANVDFSNLCPSFQQFMARGGSFRQFMSIASTSTQRLWQ